MTNPYSNLFPIVDLNTLQPSQYPGLWERRDERNKLIYYRQDGRRVCGAWSRRSKAPCKVLPMANGRCYMHGGPSLKGADVATFKHGRYSKYLPKQLFDRFQDAQEDSELLSLRADIGLLRARITELLDRLDKGESAARWAGLQRAVTDLDKHINDPTEAAKDINSIRALVRAGARDQQVWAEILTVQEMMRRLVESEQRRLVAMGQMITAEDANVLIAALEESVRQNVTDAEVLSAIARDFVRLANRAVSRAAEYPVLPG